MSKWTEKQREAIEADGMNLLVAAAAGSGKTSVLVERIIRKLLDEKRAVDIDELLVVTFTRAAAGEMRERIAAALNERLRENPSSRRLERQLVLLNAASISTFDAFCQSVVKKNFHLLDIDPNFRIGSEQELILLQQEVIEDLFEENYCAGRPEFLQFVDVYANERGDGRIYEMILELYRFSVSQPQPTLWLRNLEKAFALEEAGTFTGENWLKIILAHCRLVIEEGTAVYEELLSVAAAAGLIDRSKQYQQELGNLQAFAQALAGFIPSAAGWEKLRKSAYAIQFDRLKPLPKGQSLDEEVKSYIDRLRNRYKAVIKELQEGYFAVSHDEVMEDIAQMQPLVAELCRLTLAFGHRFSEAKRRRTLVDFNDIAHMCLALLCEAYDEDLPPQQMRPSAVARSLQNKYKEVMCDEYQDTNGVQETILRLVSRENNFFVVGDVKQSIYRFRSADSDLFLEKYTSYKEGDAVNRRVLLAQNFRSRKTVLDGVNFIFRQLMSPQVVELAYGEAEQLNAGRSFVDCAAPNLEGAVEVALIELADSAGDGETADLEGLELEAVLIGQRINALMAAGTKVMEKDGVYRDLTYRDIVILLRATEGKAEVFAQILKRMNIPVYAPGSSSYFQQLEIRILLDLLRVIDNPLQDIPLAAALCSQFGALAWSDLAQIRLKGGTGALWTDVQACLKEESADCTFQQRLREFTDRLAAWRAFASYHSVPELLWQIFQDTGYYEYVGALSGGMLRQANLRLLYDRAIEYERTSYRGLFRFLRFIERIQRSKTDLAAARTLGENENVVRVMSIHKSKGLEFPVVIVADIGKRFHYQDSYKDILLHKKYGLGAKVTDIKLEYQYPLLSHKAISYQMRLETKAEELRILYVALTRAREKLILVGRGRDLARQAGVWGDCLRYRGQLLPDYVIAAGNSYLDWLGAALIRHADGKPLRTYGNTTQSFTNCFAGEASSWQIRIVPSAQIQAEPHAEVSADLEKLVQDKRLFCDVTAQTAAVVDSILGYEYDDATLRNVPAKLSVTEMKRRFAAVEQQTGTVSFWQRQTPLNRRPRFVQQQSGLSGSEYGTLVHSALQYIQYQGVLDEVSLNRQLDEMVQHERLLPEQRQALDVSLLLQFFSSDLGCRMRHAQQVWREMPFSVLLKACEFYPDVKSTEETIFVQGMVDVLFEEKDGLVLLDYKTEGGRDYDVLAEKYRMQIQVYAAAVARIMKKPVKEKYLYFFQHGQVIAIE